MYMPKAFEGSRQQALRLMREHAFAALITPVPSESPEIGMEISHLPLLLDEQGGELLLTGHMARANAHWQHLHAAPSTAIFHGGHSYISPAGYAKPETHVPTWNYEAVHAQGPVQLLSDEDARAAMLRQAHHFEEAPPQGWRLALPPERFAAMLGAVVFFRMRVTRLECKRKLSQNRAMEDVHSLVAYLRARAEPEAAAMAERVEEANVGR